MSVLLAKLSVPKKGLTAVAPSTPFTTCEWNNMYIFYGNIVCGRFFAEFSVPVSLICIGLEEIHAFSVEKLPSYV